MPKAVYPQELLKVFEERVPYELRTAADGGDAVACGLAALSMKWLRELRQGLENGSLEMTVDAGSGPFDEELGGRVCLYATKTVTFPPVDVRSLLGESLYGQLLAIERKWLAEMEAPLVQPECELDVSTYAHALRKIETHLRGSKVTSAVVVLGIVPAAVFLLVVHLLPWKWLVNHPHSYSIQSLACVVLITAVVGALKPAWRKLLWVAVLLAAGVALLSLLGGPSKPPK